jgi:hypothetical protein
MKKPATELLPAPELLAPRPELLAPPLDDEPEPLRLVGSPPPPFPPLQAARGNAATSASSTAVGERKARILAIMSDPSWFPGSSAGPGGCERDNDGVPMLPP